MNIEMDLNFQSDVPPLKTDEHWNIEMDLGDISIFPMYLLSLDVPGERVEFIIIGAFRELRQREPDKKNQK